MLRNAAEAKIERKLPVAAKTNFLALLLCCSLSDAHPPHAPAAAAASSPALAIYLVILLHELLRVRVYVYAPRALQSRRHVAS